MTIIIYPDNTHTIDGVESGRFNGSLPIGDEVLEIPLERPGDLNRADKFKLKGGYDICVYSNRPKITTPNKMGRWFAIVNGVVHLRCSTCKGEKPEDAFNACKEETGGGFHRQRSCRECQSIKNREYYTRFTVTFKRKGV